MKKIEDERITNPSLNEANVDPKGKCYYILVFEDTEGHYEKIQGGIEEMCRKDVVTKLVHFKDEANPVDHIELDGSLPWKKMDADIDNIDLDVHYVTEEDVIEVESPRLEWWPGDFDGAVIDIYIDRGSIAEGHKYARWLNQADFMGPVVTISQYDIPTNIALSNSSHVIKKDGTEWHNKIAQQLRHSLKDIPSGIPIVSINGRNPSRSLPSILKEYGYQSWDGLWIDNTDTICHEELSERIFNYFLIDNSSKNYGQICVDYNTASNLLEKGRIEIIFIDCGNELRGSTFDKTLNLLEDAAPKSYPLPVFISNKLHSSVSREQYSDLTKKCAIFMHKETIQESPTLWLQNCAHELSKNYMLWKETDPSTDPFLERCNKLFSSFLPFYLAGHSKTSVAGGQEGFPSIALFFSKSPFNYYNLRSFTKNLNKAIDILKENNRLDGEVLWHHSLRQDNI